MIIKSLEVEGVGKFAQSTRVEGFGPGVNMLAAHNEFGKSTLLKALRAIVFMRHTSKDSWLKDLATSDAELPLRVALEFEAKGMACRLEKRFLRRVSAQLDVNGALKDGSKADEGAWDILGLKPGSKQPLDKAGFGFLWVAQGTSADAPALPEETRNTLSDAINAQIGQVAGGDRARVLLKTLKASIDAQVTSQGRSKTGGDLERVQTTLARLTQSLEDAQAQQARFEALIGSLAQAEAALKSAITPAQEADQKQAIALAQNALQTARLERASLEGLQAQAERAALVAQTAIARVADLERCRAELQTAQALLEQLQAAQADAAGGLETARQHIEQANVQLEEARLARTKLTQALGLVTLLQERDEAQSAVLRLEALIEDVQTDHEALQAARATWEHLNRLAKAAPKLDALEAAALQAEAQARAQARAGAARFSIDLYPGTQQTISLDGTILKKAVHGQSLENAHRIEISDVGTITLEPGPSIAQSGQDALAAHAALRDALSALGLDDMQSARDALHAHQGAQGQIKGLEASLQRRLKGLGSLDNLKAQVDHHRARLSDVQASLDAVQADNEFPHTHGDIMTLKAEAQHAERLEHAAQTALEQARSRWQSASELLVGCEVRLETHLRTLKSRLAQGSESDIAQRLQEARQEAAGAQAKADNAVQALEAARLALPGDDQIALLTTRVERLTSALQNQLEARSQMIGTVRRLEGQLSEAGCDGLDARIATLSDDLERAQREERRISLALNADTRLFHAIKGRLESEAIRFSAPVREAIAPYLMSVFPHAKLALDEGLEVKGMERAGLESRFDFLSTGTQEQIAILVRLALADIMARSGETPPIILDDALVYADQGRREAMFDALQHAGRTHQIIILTCHGDTFGSLGARPLHLVS
jgi:AAA domain